MTKREKEIFEILKSVAMEDGIMKLEETKIIAYAMKSAISFDWYLEESLKDGVIDDVERNKLENLKERIYLEAKELAEKDNYITPDEAKLLAKLADKLKELKNYENL